MSHLVQHIAKHLRELHVGVNWTWVNIKDQLSDVTWEEAVQQVYNCNTIAKLAYHIHYYVHVLIPVMEGNQLEAHDKFSFSHPPIESQQDWDDFLNTCLTEAETLANLIEKMPEEKLWTLLSEEKYGNFYRNLHGLIEHSHYHLGQISILKKIIRAKN